MAKMFDKVSQDFLSAIKGVLEAKKVNKHGHDHPGEEDEDIDNDGDSDKSDKYLHNRRKAIGKAMMKKESAEQIAELSTKTLRGYRAKARDDAADADAVDDERRLRKRSAGHNTAGKKIIKRGDTLRAEEVEQVDELSRATVGRYSMKAKSIADNEGGKDRTKGRELAGRKKWGGTMSGVKPAKVMATEDAEQIDELSKELTRSYFNKALDSGVRAASRQWRPGSTSDANAAAAVAKKRAKGLKMASKKMAKEDVEQMDELSKDTLHNYADKAADARSHRKLSTKKVDNRYKGVATAYKKLLAKEDVEQIDETPKSAAELIKNKIKKAEANAKARDPHTKIERDEARVGGMLAAKAGQRNEEVEQVDEISKATMGRYINKAKDSIDLTAWRQGHREAGAGNPSGQLEKKLSKRHKGIETAVTKLTKEEIEMIEAKMAGVAPGSMDCDKHMCATKVFHKEWNEGTPIKTMHADPDADGLIEWYDVMFDHGIERVMTEDMEILQAESHMHSKRKMKEEVEELDEARGRPKKAAAKDFTVHPITKQKLMHNNPEHMKTIEKLQKNKVLEKPKTEAGQHIINQLQKAKTSMEGGSTIHFTHGESKHVSGTHAAKLIAKYQGMKPSEKEDFQKKIGHSHEQLMKHV